VGMTAKLTYETASWKVNNLVFPTKLIREMKEINKIV
jgi:hypothetical protein